ncbi:MAG: DUF456 domain-containing protein [Thermacetogeniaceae bacterium]|jgi:hypothetical protein
MVSITIITLIILIIELIASIIPFVPAIPLIFVTMLIYGFIERFQHLTWLFLAGMALILIFSLFIDNAAAWLGAKRSGASKFGLWGAMIGGLVGIIISPVLGIIIGPFVGAVLAELIFVRNGWGSALKVGLGTLLGYAYGSVMRFILALAMVTAFILKVH